MTTEISNPIEARVMKKRAPGELVVDLMEAVPGKQRKVRIATDQVLAYGVRLILSRDHLPDRVPSGRGLGLPYYSGPWMEKPETPKPMANPKGRNFNLF